MAFGMRKPILVKTTVERILDVPDEAPEFKPVQSEHPKAGPGAKARRR